MAVQTFTLANLTDLTGGGLTTTVSGATFTQTALTSYFMVTFAGSVTITLLQSTFAFTGQEISIADRANFAGRPGNPITINNSGTPLGAFAFGAGPTVASITITKAMGTITLFWDGTNYGIKSQF